MLARDAYDTLLEWKASNSKKVLLVDGARQIGKTFLIEEFARREYEDYLKVDFLADSHAAAALAEAHDSERVIEMLSLLSGKRLVPGKTLVFFDEVQNAQNLVTFSKYLAQDDRFDLVMSGSMLGVELTQVKSFPVGYMQVKTMYPLSFLEFCRAQDVPESIIAHMAECYESKTPLDQSVHERLINLFRLYLIIGGMPEVVQAHKDNGGDLGIVRDRQKQLVELYREDIAKYGKSRVLQIKAIYDALPAQLDKENKRFRLQSIKTEAKYERYANDFAWITGAKAALKTTNVTDPKPMLKRSEEANRFKLYLSDVGMLMSRYGSSVALSALAGSKTVNFGAVYENFVAQELAAQGVSLHYYHNSKKGEVDFLVETGAGAALPLEVKSGKDYKRHVALNNLLKTAEYGIDVACVLSEANVSVEQREGGKVFYLPLYLLPFIAQDAKDEDLQNVKVQAPAW